MTAPVRRRCLTPMVRRRLSREAREEVGALLETFDVLTDAQLQRRGLSGDGFPKLTLTVRPLSVSTPEVEVSFRALSKERLGHAGVTLAHAAGTAETGVQLGAQPGSWLLDRGGHHHRPDAVLTRPDGPVAIEFDAGYPMRVVDKKVKAFQEFRGIVWGTPSELRASRLRAYYPELDVRVVDYWSSQT